MIFIIEPWERLPAAIETNPSHVGYFMNSLVSKVSFLHPLPVWSYRQCFFRCRLRLAIRCCSLKLRPQRCRNYPEAGRPFPDRLPAIPAKLKIVFSVGLLAYLIQYQGKVISKTELTEHLYNQDFDLDSNVIEVLINRLRKKLGADTIKTRRGLGYQLNRPDTNA